MGVRVSGGIKAGVWGCGRSCKWVEGCGWVDGRGLMVGAKPELKLELGCRSGFEWIWMKRWVGVRVR